MVPMELGGYYSYLYMTHLSLSHSFHAVCLPIGCIPLADSCVGQCQWSSSNNYHYNISLLTYHDGVSDYFINGDTFADHVVSCCNGKLIDAMALVGWWSVDTVDTIHQYHVNPCAYTAVVCEAATPVCVINTSTGTAFLISASVHLLVRAVYSILMIEWRIGKNISAGDLSSSEFYQADLCEACGVTLKYGQGTKCGSGYHSSRLEFICSSAAYEEYTYAHITDCETKITWRT
jgi:hypothetical protein